MLKQIRLRIELATMSSSSSADHDADTDEALSATRRRLSSPLRTLQVARDILARACLSSGKARPLECENLHIL